MLLFLSKDSRESISSKEFKENLKILFKNKNDDDLKKMDKYKFTFSENQLKTKENSEFASENDNILWTLKKKPNNLDNVMHMPTNRNYLPNNESVDIYFEYMKIIIEEGRKIENMRQNIVLNENFNNIDAFDFIINGKNINYITIKDFDDFMESHQDLGLLFRQYGNSKNKSVMR